MIKSNTAARLILVAITTAVTALACMQPACAAEYRAFWVDAWGTGIHSQAEVNTLLGVVGDPNSKGHIREANCNTVFIQVRRNCDTAYPSGVGEPFMSGMSPANFDGLSAAIRAAHDTTGGKKRIEVHAWIVTFRTSGGAVYNLHRDTPTGSLTELDNYWPSRTYSGAETSDKAFDPGHPLVEEYITNVVMDLVMNYDIDGIHYDYIRFTANDQGYNPTSVARYNARYGLTGLPSPGDEQWKQWRRDQVTALVRRTYAKIQAVKPWVKQSGSFVTWNPSPSASTRAAFTATRPYYDVYSDWDSWIQEGIVDMAVPMTYYNYASLPNDWTRWMNFEKDRKGNRHMIIGPGIYLNSLSNSILEIQQTRTPSPSGNYAHGFSGYSYRTPYNGGNWANFRPQLVSQVTPTWDDIPDMPWKSNPTKGHISGTVTYAANGKWADGATVTIAGPVNKSMRCDGTGFYAFIDVPPGTYTVTAGMSGYPNIVKTVTVAIGEVTGNMYVTDFSLGEKPIPIISAVQASNISNNAATITWTTDLASSSQVEYGTTTSYGTQTPVNSTPVTLHSVTLSGLTPNTVYHYRVISTNANGTATSGDFTFATIGPPSILSAQIDNTTAESATITWTTNHPTDGYVNYGTTSAYGSQVADPATGVSHTVTITGLEPSTLYHYQCVASNIYGTTQTADLTFSTTAGATDIVVDNTDPGWSNTSTNPSNTWTVAAVAGVPKIGTNYLYRNGDGSLTEVPSTRKCRWTPNLPQSGIYDVYAFYQLGTNRNTAARYTIYYDGGQVTSIQNQYSSLANQGDWFLIGQDLPFKAGTSGYVELTTMSLDTKLVSADAVKWVLKSSGDSTPPVMTSVVDEMYTTSTTSLQASWSASDPESGIAKYEYSVGSYPDAADIKGWTDAGTATSATITGLSLSEGGTYFITVRATNGEGLVSDPMTSSGVTVARPVLTIAQAKGLPDDALVGLPMRSVSAVFPGSFYVQELERASGIRIESNASVSPNDRVQVFGRLSLVDGCERALTNCKVILGTAGPAVKPMLLNIKAIGGGDFGPYTPGVYGSDGLNNIGLLVTVAGKVTAVTSDGFYLDDGSAIQDDSGNTGIKVWTGTANSATKDSMLLVTGVVSCRQGTDDRVYAQILSKQIVPR